MQFGACVKIDNIKKAKEWGYDYVELSAIEISSIDDIKWPIIKEAILREDIKVIGFNSFANASHPLIGNGFDIDSLKSYTTKLIERGKDLDIKGIGIGAPLARIRKDFDRDKAIEQIKIFLKMAAFFAKPYGINIMFEALHPHICDFITSTKDAYDIVKDLDIDNLGLVYDVYHALNSDEKLEDSMAFFDRVMHAHVSSYDSKYARFFLRDKDKKLILDTLNYFKEVGYDKTLSIEADDESFIDYGDISISLLRGIYDQITSL